ncbi:MAG: branched-chain amino acid ABC transporter permease [Clostridia bacterium]|nr:branched-chain amino acid ABC transporter permease [Clostridia bacterium]MDH7573006.1 branched-chain amino acid ABC transporter permease [Clostridia bacterium]
MKASIKPGIILPWLMIAVAFLIPAITSNSFYQSLFIVTFIWIIVNQGFNIILGYTGYCSLVQGGLYGTAAYITAILTTAYGTSPWVAALVAVCAVTVLSLLLGLVVFRTYGQFFAILTLVMGLALYELFKNLEITGRDVGIAGVPSLLPASWPAVSYYYLVLLIMLGAVAFALWLRKTRLGYALRGIGANEKLAASVGISLYKYKIAALVLASVYSGIGGVLYAYYMNFVSPEPFSVTASLYMLLAVVIGGTGTIAGPIVGSFLLVFLPAWMQELEAYQLTIYGLVVILMIRFMPRGLVSIGSYVKGTSPAESAGQ